MTNWIRSLLAAGVQPLLTVVETCPYAKWADLERHWITHFKALGCDLTNLNNGGYGPWEVSPETSAKLSAATAARNRERKGVPLSPERRARLSAIHKRRLASLTPEQRLARTAAALAKRKPGFNAGWRHSAESKAAIGKANAQRASERSAR